MFVYHWKTRLPPSVFAAALFAGATGPAAATLTISSAATSNVSCSDGICAPTASGAVLNARTLQNLLAAGSVEVTTTGNGVQAIDLSVAKGFSWSSSASLTLDAYRSLSFSGAVSVKGVGGVSLLTNDGGSGGTLWFARPAVSFAQVTSPLSINDDVYQLINSIPALASAVTNNPAGLYALSANYKSSTKYNDAPITTPLTGTVEGLGNTISGLRIAGGQIVGLFTQIGQPGQTGGSVSDLRLTSAKVKGIVAGILAGENFGLLSGDSAIGSVGGGSRSTEYHGGLVALRVARSVDSWTSGSVYTCTNKSLGALGGGLSGINDSGDAVIGLIINSYSTASVSGCAGSELGGLVGASTGTIEYSFAREMFRAAANWCRGTCGGRRRQWWTRADCRFLCFWIGGGRCKQLHRRIDRNLFDICRQCGFEFVLRHGLCFSRCK